MLTLMSHCLPGVGTFGHIYLQGELVCVTVEQAWRNNTPSLSCLPAGEYHLIRRDSPRYGPRCWHLKNANLGVQISAQGSGHEIRTHCLFHSANHPWELKGCIAPGIAFNTTTWGVSKSKMALAKLNDVIEQLPEKKIRIIRNEI